MAGPRPQDFQEDAGRPGSKHHSWMHKVPVHVWDLATGGAAGGAAVLVSMPFDTVKTYMQTHGTDLTGKGLLGSASLFWRTGQKMVTQCGLGCLYVGVTPRLLQQVPSAMLCWWSIEAVKRMLKPYTYSEAEDGGGRGRALAPAPVLPVTALAAAEGGR